LTGAFKASPEFPEFTEAKISIASAKFPFLLDLAASVGHN
jgi:hypothetical protein